MTTVISRDGILIADSRTSYDRTFNDYKEKRKKLKQLYLDDTSKVQKLPHYASIELAIKGSSKVERVYALAGAGTSEVLMKVYSYLESMKYNEIGSLIKSFCNFGYFEVNKNNGIIFLTETRSVLVILNASEKSKCYIFSSKVKEHGELVGIGSGWSSGKRVLKKIGHLLSVKECFIFCSYLDPYSSCDYTMYEAKTKTFTKLTRFTDEEIKATMDKVKELLVLYDGPKETIRLPKQESD